MEVVGAAIELVDGPSSLMQLRNIASTNTVPSPQPSFCFVVAMNLTTAAVPVTEARGVIDDSASDLRQCCQVAAAARVG